MGLVANRYTLMCCDHEAVEFTWAPSAAGGEVGRDFAIVNDAYLPVGCKDRSGHFSRSSLRLWLANRAIPKLRPAALKRLEEAGLGSASELLALGMGLGLSDQYWLRPKDSSLTWAEVNYFENDFSPLLGELLLPHDPDSVPALIAELSGSHELLAHSPDAALNGNLPKRWEVIDGRRVLVKAGRPDNRYQEPFNELLVTRLCERILPAGDYVPYMLRDEGFPDYLSLCPCMVDAHTEFVPAIHLHGAFKPGNNERLGDFFVRACAEGGIPCEEAQTMLEKILVVDYLTANFDRHWNNFGILMDAESREWLRVAPVFDTGESFWCDKKTLQAFDGYKMPKAGMNRPFDRDLDAQLDGYCKDLSWLDVERLDGFADDIADVLSRNPLLFNDAGRIGRICEAFERRVARVSELKQLR